MLTIKKITRKPRLLSGFQVVKAKITNVYNAIEDGDIAIDDMLKERITVLRNKRQEIEHKIEQYSGSQVAMMDSIDTALVKTFCEETRIINVFLLIKIIKLLI